MKEIRLLKKFGPIGVVSMFYKGTHTNLVEITKNGLLPLIVTEEELQEALKRGFGILVKNNIVMISDIPEPVSDKEPVPVEHLVRNIPEPSSVVLDDTVIDKDTMEHESVEAIPVKEEPKQTPRKSRSRKKINVSEAAS